MLRRRRSHAASPALDEAARQRAFSGPAWRVRQAWWALQEHVVWRFGDALRGLFEVARWPFERLFWLLERLLLWPLQERLGGRRPDPRLAGGAVVATAAAAVVAALVLLPSGGGEPAPAPLAATQASGVDVTPPGSMRQTAAPAPVLHGAAPVFKPARHADKAVHSGGATAGTDESGGEKTSIPPVAARKQPTVPAGPAAMAVARRFAQTFVRYEVGEDGGTAAAPEFRQTATPQLARALAARPPRLPANVKVPRARVLNVVSGPRHGKTYTISVSLLRVGLTSELRLDLRKSKGEWRVTDVKG